jgi:hypothetical protein
MGSAEARPGRRQLVKANAPHPARRSRRVPPLLAGVALLAALAIGGCGGASVSDPVPKSTPEIIPPNDTSIEKASAQTTSTSTTATKTTTTTGGEGTGEGAAGSEAAKKEGGEETSKEGAASGAGGGTAAEKEKSSEGSSKGGSEAGGGSSPTGGASAP